jgi:holo-[acyl-carrier protein] synthase
MTATADARLRQLSGALSRAVAGLRAGHRIGVDVVHIPTWQRQLSLGGEPLLKRVYTPNELTFAAGRADRLGTRLAAKEAVLKVLGTGVRQSGFCDVEIVSFPTGQPTIRLAGSAARRARALRLAGIAVSLAHEDEFAVAVALGLPAEPTKQQEELDDD